MRHYATNSANPYPLCYNYNMKNKKKQPHSDTRISLHPLSFEEAIKELTHTSKHEDSQAEESGNTKEVSPESAPSKGQSAPHPESSDD